MAHVIAVAGKGGVGKTTLCGMLIQYLCEKGKGPILAVDADANSNLNEVLGVKVETTLGDVREEIARAELAKENPIPTGMSKADYAEMRFEDALVEDDDFDLLVMGRTQGKGGYLLLMASILSCVIFLYIRTTSFLYLPRPRYGRRYLDFMIFNRTLSIPSE